MFKKLRFRIRSLVILTFSLSFIIVGAISYTAIRSIIYDNFIDLSVKNVSQKNNNLKVYMKLIEETSKQISVNPDVINELDKRSNEAKIISVLENVKQTHIGVLGAALFDVSGTPYLSSNMTEYPSLPDLKRDSSIGRFVESNELSLWSVRNNCMAGYYNNTWYNPNYGIVTFASKVMDETGVLYGYLFIDIDPHYIYGIFKNNNNKDFSDSSTAIIASSSIGILPSKYNVNFDSRLKQEIISDIDTDCVYKISADNKNILIFNNFCEGNKIVVAVPIVNLFIKLSQIMIILILVIVLLIILSVFISVMLTNSISIPLKELYSKMRNSSV